MRLFVLLIFVFNLIFINAETVSKTDSLYNIWNNQALSDTARMKGLYLLIEEVADTNRKYAIRFSSQLLTYSKEKDNAFYQAKAYLSLANYIENTDSSMLLIDKSIALFRSEEKNSWTAKCYYIKGRSYFIISKYEQAIKNLETSLTYYTLINDLKSLGKVYNLKGLAFYHIGSYANSYRDYVSSMKYRKEIGDSFTLAANYHNIAMLHNSRQDYDEAFLVLRKAVNINKKPEGNKVWLFNNYILLSTTESMLNNLSASKLYLDTAMMISKSINNTHTKATIHFKIGDYFLKINNLDSAAYQIAKLKDLSNKSNNPRISYMSDISIGKLYQASGFYEKSIAIINKVYNSSILSLDVDAQSVTLNLMYESYIKLGKYKDALEIFKKRKVLEDILNNGELKNEMLRVKYDFEYDKKSALNQQRHEYELKQEKIYKYLMSVGLFLSLIIFIILFRNAQIRKRSHKLLTKKNKLIGSQKADLEKKQLNISDSMNYARRIQNSMMLSKKELSTLFEEYFIINKPRDIVSGDFYWVYENKGVVIVAVVDCTGHGVPGAFMSMIGNALLNEIVAHKQIFDPAEILQNLNELIQTTLNQDKGSQMSQDGMDMSLCSIDMDNKVLKFAGAKNSCQLICNGELISLKADYYSIGGKAYTQRRVPVFKTKLIELKDEVEIYLYTDGYIDQFRESDNKGYGSRRFKKLLMNIHKMPMEEQKACLLGEMAMWQANGAQIDDIMVMGIRI